MSDQKTLEQAEVKRDMNLNPTGKGGFADHPENINFGGRPKNPQSFTWWMNNFKEMSVTDFLAWAKNTPNSERTVAADLAYQRVLNSRNQLDEFKEVANRTEGMPLRRQELTGADGGSIDVLLTNVEKANEIEKTDYAEFARKAKEQVVADEQLVQDTE